MNNQEIEVMFKKAAAEKAMRSDELGTLASWTMADHLDVATRALYKATDGFKGEDAVDLPMLRAVVQATYNHSAFAQKLEKVFAQIPAKAGGHHFQRQSAGKREPVDVQEMRRLLGLDGSGAA